MYWCIRDAGGEGGFCEALLPAFRRADIASTNTGALASNFLFHTKYRLVLNTNAMFCQSGLKMNGN